MSVPVYSVMLWSLAQATAATGKSGPTVPDGEVYILRDIDAWSSTGAAGDFFVLYGAAGVAIQLLAIGDGHSSHSTQWRGRQVYAPGEQLAVQVGTGTWNIQMSGYRLTLP